MSKLPTNFVKAPTPQPKPRARRPRKASLISTEPVADPKQLVLHLTDDEYQALEAARQALHDAGSEVTLEQMIHRVFAEWMMRVRVAIAEPAAAAQSTPPRDPRIHARLRELITAPIDVWRRVARRAWRTAVRFSH
jgi:hypothetical protein